MTSLTSAFTRRLTNRCRARHACRRSLLPGERTTSSFCKDSSRRCQETGRLNLERSVGETEMISRDWRSILFYIKKEKKCQRNTLKRSIKYMKIV